MENTSYRGKGQKRFIYEAVNLLQAIGPESGMGTKHEQSKWHGLCTEGVSLSPDTTSKDITIINSNSIFMPDKMLDSFYMIFIFIQCPPPKCYPSL